MDCYVAAVMLGLLSVRLSTTSFSCEDTRALRLAALALANYFVTEELDFE